MVDVTGTFWFLLICVAVAARADVFIFNKEVDGFLRQFREDILDANNTKVPLPNIRVQYDEKVLFFHVKGELNGTDGTLKDLSTTKRVTNVTIVTAKEYFVFRAEFGLDNLEIGYKYKGKLMGIPLNGQLDLSIKDNSVYVELLVNLTANRCSGKVVTIRQLRFAVLDEIRVRVTGFSLMNRIVNFWLTRSFNHVSPNVIRPIEEALRKLIKDNFKLFDFCKFGRVPHNAPFDDARSSDDISSQMYPENTNFTVQDISAVLE